MNTISLVEETSKIVNRSEKFYSQIWVVFDKDDFETFDSAIQLAKKKEFNVAWSNPCFEYWIYLHFAFSDSALHREVWFAKLDELFKRLGIAEDGYEKSQKRLFEWISSFGSLKEAVRNALRIESKYKKGIPPSAQDPCTTVHRLLLQLKPYLTDLI